MKPFFRKGWMFISMSAAIILNISNERTETMRSCLLILLIVAVLVFKSKDEFFIKPIHFSNSIYPVSALLICSCFGCNFYSAWTNSGRILRISELLGAPNKHVVIFLSVLGVLAAVPAVAAIISAFSQFIISDFEKSPVLPERKGLSAKKSFCLLTAVYLIGIIAIVRANFNYIDDMGRVLDGYMGWQDFSRFASNGLSTMIHMDRAITDISPLTQFIAVLFLALAGIILLYVVYERKSFGIWELIALIPLGLNPYFLECISYKFDSPFMALSILAAVFPLLLRNSTMWKYILAVAIGTILMCTTYQAASGIFPMVVVLLSFMIWLKNKPWQEIARLLLGSVVGFAIGLIFFKQVIMNPIESYASTSLPPLKELFPTIVTNYKHYFSLLLSDYERLWKWIIALLIIAFSLSGIKVSGRKRFTTLILTAAAEIVIFLLCFGLYPAFAKPLFEPRAMYGFGVFITLLCISTAESFQPAAMKLPAVAIAWIFFVFSFTYGNALFVQKSYTDFRITQVISDLNDMEEFLGDEPVTVQISGSIDFAPAVERMRHNSAVLSRLVPITFRGAWPWGQKGFYGYYGLKNVKQDDSIDLTAYALPLIKDGMYHTIYGEDNYVLVKLK